MIKKIMYDFLMAMLVISSLVTALGIAYLANPDFFNWVFDWLELTEAQRSYFTIAVGATTAMGWTTKILKVAVNTDTLKREAVHQLEMKQLEERHRVEMSLVRSDVAEMIRISAENQNEIIANQNIIKAQNDLILEEREANAERMISMSDTLVPVEVKEGYKRFLTNSRKTPKTTALKQFYVKDVEVIREVVKPVVEVVKRGISERVAKQRQESKDVNNV